MQACRNVDATKSQGAKQAKSYKMSLETLPVLSQLQLAKTLVFQ